MNLLLTGATGFVGGEVLRQALSDDAIERVTVLTRRKLDAVHPKLTTIVLASFLDYSDVPRDAYDACIWCLGVARSQVTRDDYVRITLDYTVAAAIALFASNPSLRFCFLSGRSADPSEEARPLFARIKGRTERRLAELGGNVVVFRPGYVRPTLRSGPRKNATPFYAPIANVLSLLIDGFSVDCDRLADCLIWVAKGHGKHVLFSNRDIRDFRSQ